MQYQTSHEVLAHNARSLRNEVVGRIGSACDLIAVAQERLEDLALYHTDTAQTILALDEGLNELRQVRDRVLDWTLPVAPTREP